MRYIYPLCLLLLAPLALAQRASGSSLLAELGKQLHQLRALPMGARTDASCPDNRDSLVGTEQRVLRQTLGAPDFVDHEGASWSYFFTSPVPVTQIGGGFPELTFKFTKNNHVSGVTCYYSR